VQRFELSLHIVNNFGVEQYIKIQIINNYKTEKMKLTIRIYLLTFLTAIIFSACNKENIDTKVPIEDPVYTPTDIELNSLIANLKGGSDEALSLRCVEIQLPFDLVKEDDSKITVFTFEEYETAISADAPNRVTDFSYPIAGIDHNDESRVFENLTELAKSFASCVPDNGWTTSTRSNNILPAFLLDGYCFSLVYPLDLEDEDGTAYTAENEEEFIDLSATIDPLFFTLPLTVTNAEDSTLVFETVDDFFEALVDCEGITPPTAGDDIEIIGFGCLILEYPFDVVSGDDVIITVNNEDEYVALLLSGVNMEIQFPFTLTNADGESQVINTVEELIISFAACGVFFDSEPSDLCDTEAHVLLFFNAFNILTINNYPYEINLPVTLIVEGEEVVINDVDDYFAATGAPFDLRSTEISYPVTVTQFGQEIMLSNDNDVCKFVEQLDEACENKPSHIQLFFNQAPAPVNCAYSIYFPVEITFDSNNIELTEMDEYLEILNTPGAYEGIELVYPIEVLNLSGGQTITFESDAGICDYLDNCQ